MMFYNHRRSQYLVIYFESALAVYVLQASEMPMGFEAKFHRQKFLQILGFSVPKISLRRYSLLLTAGPTK